MADGRFLRFPVVTAGAEHHVPVQWLEIRPIEAAVREFGFFGNQNTVCKPRSEKWRTTVERLERVFTRSSGPEAGQGVGP